MVPLAEASAALALMRRAIYRNFGKALVRKATYQLDYQKPDLSARQRIIPEQLAWLALLVSAIAFSLVVFPTHWTIDAIALCVSFLFTMVIALKVFCLMPMRYRRLKTAPRLHDEELPVYTVLVPVFEETAVLRQLLQALKAIDYPKHKLDIKLILEASDTKMHRAVSAQQLPDYFDILVVPPGLPQTKPRALNYGLQLARGSLLTIYDSEDIPQPNQLRLAAETFAVADRNVGCLQASLQFYNGNENWLTRQFAAEYAGLFKVILPQLAAQGLPILLGGTSNHFRIDILQRVGAWDPFNMTEDADLGLRLERCRFKTSMLDSATFEEANSELWNWLNQRRRWLKGFLQTWLVHNRRPLVFSKAIGRDGFWVAQSMTLGIFASALLHPFLLANSFWFLAPARVVAASHDTFYTCIAGANLALLVGGYGASMVISSIGMKRSGIQSTWFTLASMPIYWLLMSLAAWMALWDFVVRPFHWHKTKHGLSRFMKKDAERKRESYPPAPQRKRQIILPV